HREIPKVLPLPSATWAFAKTGRPRPKPRKLAESPPSHNCGVRACSLVSSRFRRKALPDPSQQLIAYISIRVQPLLTAALDGGRIGGGPILDARRARWGQP